MPLKLKDIAKMLNVSPATVSLVLNNKPGVGEKTRRKVLEIAEEAGYETKIKLKPTLHTNKNIRFLIYKKHGYVVSDTPFFSSLMEGIDKEARKNGYNLSVSYINEKQNENEILEILKENPPNGIIILATEMELKDLHEFMKLSIPTVILDSYFKEVKLDTIIINNKQGSYEAAKHLINNGHTEIGYLHSSVWINNFDERQEGFLKALKDYNMEFNKKYLFRLDSTLDGSYKDMLEMLKNAPKLPTAFFADNDIIAFGAVKALKEKGIKIPDDVSIVGFDDMPYCEMLDPALTTVCVYKQSMGKLAVKRLIEKMENNETIFIKIEVGIDLVERNSVKKII